MVSAPEPAESMNTADDVSTWLPNATPRVVGPAPSGSRRRSTKRLSPTASDSEGGSNVTVGDGITWRLATAETPPRVTVICVVPSFNASTTIGTSVAPAGTTTLAATRATAAFDEVIVAVCAVDAGG